MSQSTNSSPTLIPPSAVDEDLPDTEFPRLSDEEEDMSVQVRQKAILKHGTQGCQDTTASFVDWVTQFIHRVYQLQENLPEEGGGASEGNPLFLNYFVVPMFYRQSRRSMLLVVLAKAF